MTMRAALLGSLLFLFGGTAWADTCTLIADAGTARILKQDGNCDGRSTPASTFKIALSLMGYDADILKDENDPAWVSKTQYGSWWKRDRVTTADPATWLSDSVVWYSQLLTLEMGDERFQAYVTRFGYGNRDLSGDIEAANWLTNAWLSSSLQISPAEQIDFLRKIYIRELPVSAQAYDKTLAIMPSFSSSGWAVHGKTGTGFQNAKDGSIDRNRQIGWFVGWAHKNNRAVVFAQRIRDERKTSGPAGLRARDRFLAELAGLQLP